LPETERGRDARPIRLRTAAYAVVVEDSSDHVQVPSLPDVIYERLRREIATGQLQPGPLRLRPLAERFGTSPIPVREALRRLEADRLVSFLSNRAITVNAISADELDEIFAIRQELESLALRRALPRIVENESTVRELRRLIERMDAQDGDPGAWRTTNEAFHKCLYEAADSPRLLAVVENLWVAIEPYLRMYVTSVPSLRQAQEQHRALLEAIIAGDAAQAEAILRDHLDATRSVVLGLMSE
jgi:DNA-binding GntR family transcriptional regulator